jgi:hypothetical protein
LGHLDNGPQNRTAALEFGSGQLGHLGNGPKTTRLLLKALWKSPRWMERGFHRTQPARVEEIGVERTEDAQKAPPGAE